MLFYLLLALTFHLTQGGLIPIGFAPPTPSIPIILTNHEGWDEKNVRTFYDILKRSHHDVQLVAPRFYDNGLALPGSPPDDDLPPIPLEKGRNATDPRQIYYNQPQPYPIAKGIKSPSTRKTPELALVGPNIGAMLGKTTVHRAAMRAARYAVRKSGIPAIVFAGASGHVTRWDAPTPDYSVVYGRLAFAIMTVIVASGPPYLPPDTILKVNFDKVNPQKCRSTEDFRYILTREDANQSLQSHAWWCKRWGFPYEGRVLDRDGIEGHQKPCTATLSLLSAAKKSNGPGKTAEEQIIEKLKSVVTCF